MSSAFVHIELNSNDRKKAGAFYSRLFDWKLQPMQGTQYGMIQPGEGPGGGLSQNMAKGRASHGIPYVRVDDVDASAAKAKKLGAKVLTAPMDLPGGMGRMAVLRDPAGAPIGLWKPGA